MFLLVYQARQLHFQLEQPGSDSNNLGAGVLQVFVSVVSTNFTK